MKSKKVSVLLFIILFTLSISIIAIPCSLVNVYGLFGEVKSIAVMEEEQTKKGEYASVYEKHCSVKRNNIYNIWFEIAVIITCLIYSSYMIRLPREDTIVTLKVRMDN